MVASKREKLVAAVMLAKTFDEVLDIFGISGSSPEAWYSEIVWEALLKDLKQLGEG